MDNKSFHFHIPKRWVRVALIIGATALIVAPLTAIASHSFTDVPDSNTFHADIAWLADAGVTKGCNPPANTEFCPNDDVSRGQMSAFLRRLSENKVVDAATAVNADNATTADSATTAGDADTVDGKHASAFLGVNDKAADSDKLDGKDGAAYTNPVVGDFNNDVTMTSGVSSTELAELSITTPSASGLVLWAQLTPQGLTSSLATFWFQVDNATCTFDTANFFSVMWGRLGSGNTASSASIQAAVATSAGAHTVTVCGFNFSGATFDVDTSLTAMYATDVTTSGSVSAVGADGGEGTPSS